MLLKWCRLQPFLRINEHRVAVFLLDQNVKQTPGIADHGYVFSGAAW